MKLYNRKAGKVEVMRFGDNHMQQTEVSSWIERNGATANLYDGCIERNVDTSIGNTWRWNYISIDNGKKGRNPSADIGDYIVKDIDGEFKVFTPEMFSKNFISINDEQPTCPKCGDSDNLLPFTKNDDADWYCGDCDIEFKESGEILPNESGTINDVEGIF